MMKHHINSFFKKTKIDKSLFLFLFFVLMSTLNTQAQTKIITGIVKDEIGSPLPGVSVSETGTLNGVSTDFDGKYSINTKVGSTLTFGYLGYKSIVKTVGKENIINVTLNPDIENLDEIVVIGYGSVQKKDLTGSVAIVNMEKLTEAPVVSFDKALAGRVAGVQVSGGLL